MFPTEIDEAAHFEVIITDMHLVGYKIGIYGHELSSFHLTIFMSYTCGNYTHILIRNGLMRHTLYEDKF